MRIYYMLTFVLVIGLMYANAPAKIEDLKELDVYYDEIENMNHQMMNHPVISKLFSDEKINIYINGHPYAHAITSEGQILKIEKNILAEPTIKLSTNTDTIEDLINHKTTVEQALDNDRIKYKGVGLGNGIRIGVYNFFYNVFS